MPAGLRLNQYFIISDAAITNGELDVERVLGRQKMVEEARTLQKFVKKRDELDQDITTEIEELKMMSENCEGDKNTIGMLNVLA